MTTFSVWKFDDPDGADRAMKILKGAEHDRIVKVLDHATVRWPKDADLPETELGHDERLRGSVWGGFLGVVIGMLFFVPVLGGVVGASIGAAAKAMSGTGIRRDQLDRIRAEVTPGTSALFIVSEEGDLDRLGERFHQMNRTFISTNLTTQERTVLLETFGGQ
ncbi:MAG TPA: DUF1269 domain-containing protein [Kineosporiaceae bacterium]|nr:DUF1269 domain-containing protein [Kineosporiaceae bacterium]